MIEQAFYASARSHERDGYQVVAASPGAAPEDLRELSVWCPSHDGLLDEGGTTASVNAFPLPSGARCVARSFAADPEYSSRGGTHVVTQAFILSAADYLRFANNPFAVMSAAVAAGHATSQLPKERQLSAFNLVGRTRAFDRSHLRQAVAKYSLPAFAAALDACLEAETCVLATDTSASQIMAALLTSLPVGIRARISLATGLVYSPSRPYQWIAHKHAAMELRRLARSNELRVVSLSENLRLSDASAGAPSHAWAALVSALLEEENYLELERRMRDLASVDNLAELDALSAAIADASAASVGPANLGSISPTWQQAGL
jgi:hypothetical protein